MRKARRYNNLSLGSAQLKLECNTMYIHCISFVIHMYSTITSHTSTKLPSASLTSITLSVNRVNSASRFARLRPSAEAGRDFGRVNIWNLPARHQHLLFHLSPRHILPIQQPLHRRVELRVYFVDDVLPCAIHLDVRHHSFFPQVAS